MRFMLLVIPKGYENAAPGTMPEADAVAEMMKFNRALKDAGILRALDGLHPPSMGARVSFKGGKASVTDGPFAETHEVLGGYWIIDVASKVDAVAWAKRAPMADNDIIVLRGPLTFGVTHLRVLRCLTPKLSQLALTAATRRAAASWPSP